MNIPPQFFDILVLLSAAVGIILAGRRLMQDLRGGPRFSDAPPDPDLNPNPSGEKTQE